MLFWLSALAGFVAMQKYLGANIMKEGSIKELLEYHELHNRELPAIAKNLTSS